MWEKRYDLNRDETFKSIQYDPFDSSKLYILTSVCIMKQIDFGLSLPKKSARRVYLDDAKRSFYVGREAQDIQSSVLKKVGSTDNFNREATGAYNNYIFGFNRGD